MTEDKTTGTSWLRVAILIGAGAAVALQIGKVPAALPALQAELGLSLVQSAWVVAIFSVIAAGFAVFLGTVSDRFGPLSVAISGMLLSVGAGALGGLVTGGGALLAWRVLEGLGFILTTTSIPPLIMAAASQKHQKASLALWGMYMPLGSGLMLALSGPLLFYYDWRVLWWITSGLILLAAIPVYLVGRRISDRTNRKTSYVGFGDPLRHVLRRGPLMLSTIFAIYAAQYMIVAGFLPLILIDIDGFSPIAAASVAAGVVFCNALGNGLSGWLHNCGFKFVTLILAGSLGMAIGSSMVFALETTGFWRVVAAAGFCGFAGLVPSSLFSVMPKYSPNQSVVSTISGMLVQGAAIGQLVGPPIAAATVVWFGNWSATIPVMIFGATITAGCALFLARGGNACAESSRDGL